MTGQGILIIIVPNDVSILENPTESTPLTHSPEYPCELCGNSLASRFRHHISPKLNLNDAVWMISDDRQQFFITCFAELGKQSDLILEELRLAEIGIRTGSKIFILPLSCALGISNVNELPTTTIEIDENEISANESEKKDLLSEKGEFRTSVRARLTVLQVVNVIRGQTSFSFDFLVLTILASIIALLGLLENNSVILVASMLVSPLMGPILGIVFGLAIGDPNLWKVGLRTEIIGLLVSICTGFLVGLSTTWSETRWGSTSSFPTDEMRSRGNIYRLWAGVLVAVPSGAGAALSVLGGNIGSLVGVAISASLLPPAVNAGVLLAYSLLSASVPSIGRLSIKTNDTITSRIQFNAADGCPKFVENDYRPIYTCFLPFESLMLSLASFLLTLANIFCIIVMAMIILRVKEVVPLRTDDEIAEFWHDDIHIVRDENRAKKENDLPNLVNIWKEISSVNQPIESSLIRPKSPNRDDVTMAEKLRLLDSFARAYYLDMSNVNDRHVQNEIIRRKVQRMAGDLITSIEESNRKNFDRCIAQVGSRTSTISPIQRIYQDLFEVMPSAWKEIFQKEQQQRTLIN